MKGFGEENQEKKRNIRNVNKKFNHDQLRKHFNYKLREKK